jgi:crossover junction endodeoxyribonuclease RuvC
MIILGIDPGTTRIGYGVIEASGSSLSRIESGLLEIENPANEADRLHKIGVALEKLIDKTNPKKIGVERLFFSKNKKTDLSVAEARGVIVATIARKNISLCELTPNEIKLAVTGSGNASKRAVSKMVSLMLRINVDNLLDDETDALAIAIASANLRIK